MPQCLTNIKHRNAQGVGHCSEGVTETVEGDVREVVGPDKIGEKV